MPPGEGDLVVGVDAGGSTTRAVVARLDGTCLGWARGPAGNPTSSGPERAHDAITTTAARALAGADADLGRVRLLVVCLAGAQQLLTPATVAAHWGHPALAPRVAVAGDILAMFRSGGPEASGAAVVAGTGSVAARVERGALARTVGGTGWLLGDGGSGFAIGRAVVRAVLAALDGLGPETALTPLLLSGLGLDDEREVAHDARPVVVTRLMGRLYAEPPVGLARLAPTAFAASSAGDAVAAAILDDAERRLATLVDTVRTGPDDEPLVLGGSVLHQVLARSGDGPLRAALAGATVRTAADGALGATAEALARLAGTDGEVPADAHARLTATLAEVRARVSS
ncbi:N-acetylglucosamine kinase [Phycicoccus flavus]|uniref:ATPase n=1 Tax=Phycicoccus flavus TaxID=2502783 RepID=A0A8T6R1X3_9MICO|nr:BadF/BadG/BcrA/BcrD ATPase family protein [Phycicoccus flavus]NHA67886.1 ATPase [Phycicoccus flavus]